MMKRLVDELNFSRRIEEHDALDHAVEERLPLGLHAVFEFALQLRGGVALAAHFRHELLRLLETTQAIDGQHDQGEGEKGRGGLP